jgi:phage head maturation protease
MTLTLVETGIETRAAHVAEVNFPKRLVTVIAMPYEQPTQIHERGRSFTEVVTRGAFDGIEKRARSKLRVNRDHIWDKLVGKVVGLHPSRTEGLVTEIRMFGTDIGERTLIECDEGGLDASAGFALLRRDEGRGPVWDDAEVWEQNRSLRRLNRLWLDHVALVPDPAYPGAVVESVRNTPTGAQEPLGVDATPNRDRLTVAEQKAAADALNRRWVS